MYTGGSYTWGMIANMYLVGAKMKFPKEFLYVKVDLQDPGGPAEIAFCP